jgi:hypothetical protein
MSEPMNNRSVQVLGMCAIGAATVAVFWLAEGFEEAWPVRLIPAAFIALVHFGRARSNTLEVMSGTGDERVRSLYTPRWPSPARSWPGGCRVGSS